MYVAKSQHKNIQKIVCENEENNPDISPWTISNNYKYLH